MESIEGGKTEEPNWRREATRDIQKFVTDAVLSFNRNAEKAFDKCPLVENIAEVKEGFTGALIRDVFFHIFTGFVGCDLELEEKLISELRDGFKAARLKEFERNISGKV